jgi:hypothetical protein
MEAPDNLLVQLHSYLYPLADPDYRYYFHCLPADYMPAVVSQPSRDFEDLNLQVPDSKLKTLEIVVPYYVAIEDFVDHPCAAIRSQTMNTEHYVALLAQSFDALAIVSVLVQIQNDVEPEPVVKQDFRHAYNDKDLCKLLSVLH